MFFEVEDNGIGISRRAIKRIFDRFYQVDQTLSRQAGGCGLGLAIVKFIVRAHGGTADVVSSPGRGSTFTARLPVEKHEARNPKHETSTNDQDATKSKTNDRREARF